jgi:hypothetical protein
VCKVVLIIRDQTAEPYNKGMGEDHLTSLEGATNITENQFGFMSERSTMKAIFL